MFSRRCLLGTACDWFLVTESGVSCRFQSHVPFKGMVFPHKHVRRDFDAKSLYILHCTTAQENVVKNTDFFTHSHIRKLCYA